MWCVPEVTEEFVERMEDVLELYAGGSGAWRDTIPVEAEH
jgi:hypothetical protein